MTAVFVALNNMGEGGLISERGINPTALLVACQTVFLEAALLATIQTEGWNIATHLRGANAAQKGAWAPAAGTARRQNKVDNIVKKAQDHIV